MPASKSFSNHLRVIVKDKSSLSGLQFRRTSKRRIKITQEEINMTNWTEEIKEVLKTKTEKYSIQELKNVNFEYLNNLLVKIESGTIDQTEELKSKIEYVVNEMPKKTEDKRIIYKNKHLNEITNLQTYVEQKFNFVKKGRNRRRCWAFGIPLGMSFGMLFAVVVSGNLISGMLIGMPIGMIIGLNFGNYLDEKAETENRVL
jgi:hypothetical protein